MPKQKGVMISHRNVIANTLQYTMYHQYHRDPSLPTSARVGLTEYCLGLLPMSHIYSLIVVCHVSIYRGDGVILLPRFEFSTYLKTIQEYRIATLYLVGLLTIYYFDRRHKG